MPTRNDPTRTTRVRRAFERDVRTRFRSLKRDVVKLVVEEDAFGLVPGQPFQVLAERQVWRFQTSEQKVKSFRRWFQKRVDEEVLETNARDEPWTAKYVESAYKKGQIRAFTDAMGKKAKSPEFFEGSRTEFLRSSFAQGEQVQKVKLLSTRSFENLRGVSSSMASKMNQVLADGLVQGQNPRAIARAMAKNIEGVSKQRALTIARTEVIHAHAEGQLDSFEELGVQEVGVFAEWSTADDEKVCPLCEPLDGVIMTVKEARGKLPRHPNCRCAWIPAIDVKSKGRRESLISKVAKSLRAEGGREGSSWAGKNLRGKRG